MTPDRMKKLKEEMESFAAAFPSESIDIYPRDVLDLIEMVQNYGAEIDRLHEEIEGLRK